MFPLAHSYLFSCQPQTCFSPSPFPWDAGDLSSPLPTIRGYCPGTNLPSRFIPSAGNHYLGRISLGRMLFLVGVFQMRGKAPSCTQGKTHKRQFPQGWRSGIRSPEASSQGQGPQESLTASMGCMATVVEFVSVCAGSWESHSHMVVAVVGEDLAGLGA